jgi:hypothetical protein
MGFRMDEMDELHFRMRITNLQARLELREIEIIALSREIASPLTTSERRAEAIELRYARLNERSEVTRELDEIHASFPQFDRLKSRLDH